MKKLKNLAMMLTLIFIVNFIPVNAYVWGSNFGISDIGINNIETGERKVYVEFNEDAYKDIKEVKLYTKVSRVTCDHVGNIITTTVDGPNLNLNVKESNKFTGILKEDQITSFGSYEVDKVEMVLNNGSKRVSYNSGYYKSLSNNNKENAELVNFNSLFVECTTLYAENPEFEFTTVKLGQAQNHYFNIISQKLNVSPNKVYVTFSKLDDESNKEHVVIAEKIEDDKYSAHLTLSNSLDTGLWKVSKIKVVDNYKRECELEYSNPVSFNVVSANTDIEAPKLNSIEISSNLYDGKIKEPLKFTLNITDDFSGVDYADITITNGDKEKGIHLRKDDLEDGEYIKHFREFTENGTWKIKSIRIADNAGNYVCYVQNLEDYMTDSDEYIEMDFSDKAIEVINIEKEEVVEEEDANIEILELINNKTEVSNGNEVGFEIKFKSNMELYDINFRYYEENLDKYLYFSPSIGDEYGEEGNIIENKDGIYTFKFKGNSKELEYLASGKYKCTGVDVMYRTETGKHRNQYFEDDKNPWNDYNSKVYDFSKLDFVCKNPNEDINPPEVEDISIDKSIITPGETVELRIKVKDDRSGFSDKLNTNQLSLYYSNSVRDFYGSTYDYDEELGEYKIKIKVPEYYSSGRYTIGSLFIRDMANNDKYYYWYNEEDKELLSKGTILVKTDLNEKLPPEISTNIQNNGEAFKAPFTPIVNSDHGTIEMLLDGKKYEGEAINKLGNHQLYIKAIGLDGSVSTKLVSFKVIAEINNETKPEDIVNQIVSSPENVVEVEVKDDKKEIDKSIFEAIKGKDKTVSFKQEDGTVWSFNGMDITEEKLEGLGNIKISVSNTPEEKNKEPIEEIDSGARVIHFDYHGVLPGKATVKIKVNEPGGLLKKDLTFYYFNPDTQKAEKVQGPLSIDNDGYVTVEIEHCSDYFLSLDDTLHLEEPSVPEEPEKPVVPVITVEKDKIELIEGENKYIGAKVTPENTKLEYTSSDENIVIVNESGLITAKKEGIAKITIKAGNVTKEINVEVKKKVVPGEPQEPKTPVVPEETIDENNKIDNEKENLPKTGDVVSSSQLIIISMLAMSIGIALFKKKKIVK